MDDNKLQTLREVGYSIPRSCGLCTMSFFQGGSAWGTCALHAYEHLKHTGPQRQLSVHRCGQCPQFQVSEPALVQLGRYREFVR